MSRNGVLLNPPPAEEMDKWIASANFSQEEKQDYRSGVGVGVGMSVGNVSSDKNAKYAIQREKELRKHRIVLNRMKPFDYYAVLCYTGCKSDDKITIVNMNVGGAVFRMYDEHFRSGLL